MRRLCGGGSFPYLGRSRSHGWKPLKATATATKPIATEPRAPRSAAKKPRAGTKQAVAAKKGAPKLQQCSVLATVTCDDGVLARRLLSQPHQPPDAYIVLHLSRRLQGVSGRSKRLSLGGSSSSTSESWPSPPSSRHIRGRRATWRSWHLGQTS